MMLKTYVASHRLGIDIQNISFDIMLASYIIDPSRTISDVQSVVSLYGQSFVKDDVSIYGKGKKFKVPEDDVLNPYVASITDAIYFAKPNMDKQLEEYNQVELLADLELPLAKILSEMEEIGIFTDVHDLEEMEKEIQEN